MLIQGGKSNDGNVTGLALSTVRASNGTHLYAFDEQNRKQDYLVEAMQRVGGALLGSGNYANPTPAINSPYEHNETANRNAIGAHDDIYRRKVTISDISGGGFEVGEKLLLSDRFYAPLIIISSAVTANGVDSFAAGTGKLAVIDVASKTVDSRWYGNTNETLQKAINNAGVTEIKVINHDVSSGSCYVDRSDLIFDCSFSLLDFTDVGHPFLILGQKSDGGLSNESKVNIEIKNVLTAGNRATGSQVVKFRKASTCTLSNWRAWSLETAFNGDGTDLTHLSLCCEFRDLDIRYCKNGFNDTSGSFQGSKFIGCRIEANDEFGIVTATTNLQLISSVVEGNGRNGGTWDGNGGEIKLLGGGSFAMIGGYMERFASLINKAFILVDSGSTKRVSLFNVDIYGQDSANAEIVNGADWTTGSLYIEGCNINECARHCSRAGSAGNWFGYFNNWSDSTLADPELTLNGGAYFAVSRAGGLRSSGNIRCNGSVQSAVARVQAIGSTSSSATYQRYIGAVTVGGAGDWKNVIALTDIQAASGVTITLDMTFNCRQGDFRFKTLIDLTGTTVLSAKDDYAGNWTSSLFRIDSGYLQVDNLPASSRQWNCTIKATRTAFS